MITFFSIYILDLRQAENVHSQQDLDMALPAGDIDPIAQPAKEETIEEDIKPKQEMKKPEMVEKSVNGMPNVLLLTYLRSGSSFTGALFQKSPNTFYLFEPIQHLLKSVNQANAYYIMDYVCTQSGNCRYIFPYLISAYIDFA